MKNLYKCNLEDHLHRRKKTKSKNSITSSLNYYEWSNNYSTRCKRCLHLYKNEMKNLYKCNLEDHLHRRKKTKSKNSITSSLNYYEWSNNYSTRCKRCLHLYKNDNWHFQNIYAIWRIIFIEEKRPSPKTLYVTSSLNHHERSNNYSTRCKRCLHLYKNGGKTFTNATWRIISIEEKESSPKTL